MQKLARLALFVVLSPLLAALWLLCSIAYTIGVLLGRARE